MRIRLAFSLLLAFTSIQSAQARQESNRESDDLILEEVIVTAQKREENLLDVPVSVIVVPGEKIADADITSLEELQTYVPNLTVTDSALGPRLHIRGVSSGINQGFEQSVGVYVDGVYRGRSLQSRMALVDIERVEVLRGPQSILFGKNSIAGALNILTRKPTDSLDIGVTGLYSWDFDQRELAAFISGPMTDTLTGRLTAYARDIDGYMENLILDRDEPKREERMVRGQIGWNPTDSLDINLRVELARYDVSGEGSEIINDRTATAGPFTGLNYAQILILFGQDPNVANNYRDRKRTANGDELTNDTEEYVLTANYHYPGGVTLTSTTGYSAYDSEESCDCDFTGGKVFDVDFEENFDQFSQEVRLMSPGGETVDWIAGVYYQENNLHFHDSINVGADSVLVPIVEGLGGPGAGGLIAGTSVPRYFNQDTELFSAFGQLTWNVSDRWYLTFGGRISKEKKQADRILSIATIDGAPLPGATAPYTRGLYANLFNITGHAIEGRRSVTRFMPSVEVQFDITGGSMTYFSVSRGNKSGGYDARSNNPPSNGGSFEFEDEDATSYELGAKMLFNGGATELNVAIYYMNYDNLQSSAFDGVLGFNVGNAAEAVAKGVELDARWLLTDHLLLSGSLAFTHFEYRKYFGECYFGQVPDAPDGINCDYRGKTNVLTPDYSGVLSANYKRPLGDNLDWGLTVDLLFSDKYMTSSNLDPLQVQESYTKLNARLSIGAMSGRWELALVGKNLTDEPVINLSADVPLAGGSFGTPGFSAGYEQPRSVAIQAIFRY